MAGTYQPPQYPPQPVYTGYNPPQPEYDLSKPAYNPPAPAYNPPAPAYNPPAYNPPAPAYNPPAYNPPAPAYYAPAAVQQQTTNTVVVMQPQSTVTRVFTPVGDYGYNFSIVLSFLFFFCGCCWALCCTIPAIFVASSAREAAARGDIAAARSSGNVAQRLNIAGLVSSVVVYIIIIALSASHRSA